MRAGRRGALEAPLREAALPFWRGFCTRFKCASIGGGDGARCGCAGSAGFCGLNMLRKISIITRLEVRRMEVCELSRGVMDARDRMRRDGAGTWCVVIEDVNNEAVKERAGKVGNRRRGQSAARAFILGKKPAG